MMKCKHCNRFEALAGKDYCELCRVMEGLYKDERPLTYRDKTIRTLEVEDVREKIEKEKK